ncbi:hypothetical protein [Flavobacterium sp. LC2016-01]|uniref:hypothetical protein n=1 Tax=Flavobacterium sp. LC2016-01 TaxID=2675876 RepID=UPI0012BA5B11|nr:hypothetical protein [Flavobacterium sp. LC2016-01]MTH16823.1 hypothetical protein [Flavobacterium sp. LC2016-01]
MVQKIILTIFLLFSISVESQSILDTSEEVDNSIGAQLYTKCFENLNQGDELFEKHPALKSIKFCSLFSCSYLLSLEEEEIQLVGEKRLIGIATQLFREGNPVYLIRGLDSSLDEKAKNQNLTDDNHLVYISYGECTNPPYLIRAAEIVNKQTELLIKQSQLK